MSKETVGNAAVNTVNSVGDPLKAAVAELMQRAISGLDSATSFLEAQIPDVVQQLLTWYMVKYSLHMVAGVIIIGFLILLATKKLIPYLQSGDVSLDGKMLAGLPFCVAVIVLCPISICLMNIKWLQIWIAPKIWLIEYSTELIK